MKFEFCVGVKFVLELLKDNERFMTSFSQYKNITSTDILQF